MEPVPSSGQRRRHQVQLRMYRVDVIPVKFQILEQATSSGRLTRIPLLRNIGADTPVLISPLIFDRLYLPPTAAQWSSPAGTTPVTATEGSLTMPTGIKHTILTMRLIGSL